jgi:hypothetical protein
MTEQIYGRRKADHMPDNNNDHDLLVRLDTKVTLLLEQQNIFTQSVQQNTKELAERVAKLEVKDSKDSGKFEAISADVQRSLANYDSITKLQARVDGMEKDLEELRKKANLFDYINAAGVVITGILASIGLSR